MQMGGLPPDLTAFVGRRRELAQVRGLLRQTRLLTLTGVGGIGKTRLAIEAVRGPRVEPADGVKLVELAAVAEPDQVTRAVADALGIARYPREDPWQTLAGFIGDKQILLVLDNCEHLLESCASFAQRVLELLPGVKILATSRQPLGTPGEHRLDVLPLAVPQEVASPVGHYDSVTLFELRAQAVSPEFVITDANRRHVIRLCQLTDGIPLAIELAAARMRALSVADLVDHFGRRFDVLTTGNRLALPRQQTLRAAMEWSYELCSVPEQSLWQRLAIFRGSFELAAATDVCSGDGLASGDIPALVASLFEKSVVVRADDSPEESRPRYKMLETVREYGRLRMDNHDKWNILRQRHVDWFARLVDQAMASEGQPDVDRAWHDRLRRDTDNLRVALLRSLASPQDEDRMLDFVSALATPRCVCGSLADGRQWIDKAVAAHRATESPALAKALWTGAWLAGMQGDLAAARDYVRDCEQVAQRIADESAQAYAATFDGMTQLWGGMPARAVQVLVEAFNSQVSVGAPFGQGMTMVGLTIAQCFARDEAAEGSVALCKAAAGDNPVVEAYASWLDALRLLTLGRLDGVESNLIDALTKILRSTDEWLAPMLMETLAWATVLSRDHARAARLFGAAERMRRTIGCDLAGLKLFQDPHEEYVALAQKAGTFWAEYWSGFELDKQGAVLLATGARGRSGRPAAGSTVSAHPLTRRELQVAELVARGLTNRDIAGELFISQRTAETHVEHILTKLGFTARSQITAWLSEHSS